MKNKKLLLTPILLTLIAIFSFPAFGQGKTKILITDSMVELNIISITEKNRTLIPLREVSQKFDIEVEKYDNNKSFVCKTGDKFIKFNLGEKIANVNGKNIMLDSLAKNINGVLYVPMRTLFESLDYNLEWDGANSQIKISEAKEEEANEANEDKSIKIVDSKELKPSKYIAHAGGRINGQRLTNSKEAIEQSYRSGYDLIEIDMEWSTDGNLVLVHDWGNFDIFINSSQERSYSSKEFKSFKMQGDLTPLTIDDVAKWLEENYGVYMVTDIKTSNLQALQLIKDKYPHLIDRFIPQIYHFNEYEKVKNMGYKYIIMTMYMSNYSHKEILDFAKNNKLFAVTMPISTAKSGLPSLLAKENIFVYTHTVNTKSEEEDLIKHSVHGLYTDDLMP